MTRSSVLRIQKRENELYRQVEDLRRDLYLHHHSPLYQAYKMHAEVVTDVRSLFVRKQPKKIKIVDQQHITITSLERQLRLLTVLSHSPYMGIIRWLRMAKWGALSVWYSLRTRHSTTVNNKDEPVWVMFGARSYDEIHTRSVSIAEQLAKNSNVVYIEPQLRNGYKPGYAVLPVKPTLSVVQLKQVKKTVKQSLTLLLKSYKKSKLRFLVMSTEWLPFITNIKNTIYIDRPHELIKIPHDKRFISVAPHTKRVNRVIPNGVNYELFKDASKTVETCDVGLCWIKRPVIGYIGDLDERIDEELIGKTATAFPKATIVLVGNTNYRPVIAVSEKHDNIFPVGQQPSSKLSLYLQSFDILILPTRSSLKYTLTHESLPIFLSSGKPIVCLTTRAIIKGWKKILYASKNHTGFLFQVEKALKESKKSKKRQQRIKIMQKLLWNVGSILH